MKTVSSHVCLVGFKMASRDAAASTEEMIEELSDLGTAIDMLEEFGINTDEVEDLEEARLELRKYFSNTAAGNDDSDSVRGASNWTVENVSSWCLAAKRVMLVW